MWPNWFKSTEAEVRVVELTFFRKDDAGNYTSSYKAIFSNTVLTKITPALF